MADIFISYARADRDKIEKLASALEAEGYSVWWDRQIVGGAEYSKDIETALNEARAVVVAWSEDAIESTWVKDEAITAREQGKLIPISLDGSPAPMGFKQFHLIDLADWSGDARAEGLGDLTRTIKARLTGEAPPSLVSAAVKRKKTRAGSLHPSVYIVGIVALAIVSVIALSRGGRDRAPASEPASASVSDVTAAEQVPDSSIAVLPFADLSPDGDQEYFSDGIAEEILNALAQVSGLTVASRTSSFAFKRQESLGIPAIAAELGVRHVLEGSVRKAGDTLRITVQLIDADSDKHLWSQNYDRPLTAANIFAVQEEIAAAVVAALSGVVEMPGAPTKSVAISRATSDLSAYDLYLQARGNYQTRKRFEESEALLDEAVRRDPAFADAWALRAANTSLYKEYVQTENRYEIYGKRVDDFASRALALDPDNARAIAARANFRMTATWNLAIKFDLGAVMDDLERALALDPRDSSAANWLGMARAIVGENDKALAAFSACEEFDPYFGPCAENLYDMLVILERYDEALAQFERVLSKGISIGGWANFSLLAHFDERIAFMQAANHPSWLEGWRRQSDLYEAFKHPERDHSELIAELLDFASTNPMAEVTPISNVVIPIGGYDVTPFALSLWAPDHAGYRRSPQFKTFIRESGVYDYWRSRGFPPQCRPLGADDFECE